MNLQSYSFSIYIFFDVNTDETFDSKNKNAHDFNQIKKNLHKHIVKS